MSADCIFGFQAVEELLESLDLEKSNYHMGLSKVSGGHTLFIDITNVLLGELFRSRVEID